MLKTLKEYRALGEYFFYGYEAAVSLLQTFVKNKALKPKPQTEALLLPRDYGERIEILKRGGKIACNA
jgi:hypothetical protein